MTGQQGSEELSGKGYREQLVQAVGHTVGHLYLAL